ncbi:hypothetical protein D3C76_795880 [compost metagenome]
MTPAIILASLLLIVDAVLLWHGVLKSPPKSSKRTEYNHVDDGSQELEEITRLMHSIHSNPIHTTRSEGAMRHPIDAGELESGVRELRKLMDQWQSWQQKLDMLLNERKTYQVRVSGLTHELSRRRKKEPSKSLRSNGSVG